MSHDPTSGTWVARVSYLLHQRNYSSSFLSVGGMSINLALCLPVSEAQLAARVEVGGVVRVSGDMHFLCKVQVTASAPLSLRRRTERKQKL